MLATLQRDWQAFLHTCRRRSVRPTRQVLLVSVRAQRMLLVEERIQPAAALGFQQAFPAKDAQRRWHVRRRFVVSTSRFGIGQVINSNRTPLGLHRIADKVGAGQPIGTVFRSRQPVGLTWDGHPDAPIAHRILWLDGLETGFNRGGNVDTHARYIYIHGLGSEPTLGRPASRGCIHMAAAELLPLFDRIPAGTLVWIC